MKNSFFCEACGTEVKGRADHCPSCGRSFLGIRCPRCGREGNADEFLKGCPDCGYMADIKSSVAYSVPPRKIRKERPLWPTSRYLVLSGLILIVIGVTLYLWIN